MTNLSFKEKIKTFYDVNYKTLLIITLVIFGLALLFLAYKQFVVGELIVRGISLKGGVELTFPAKTNININSLQSSLRSETNSNDLTVRSTSELGVQKDIIVESSDVTIDLMKKSLETVGFKLIEGEYSSQQIGSKLGEKFFNQMFLALLFAIIAIAIVVYITFRELIPSLFVMIAAIADLVTVLAVLSFFNITLSIAGVAAFLMMLGYSVDTDILLTTRVLKTKTGTVLQRIHDAMRTGITMTVSSFVAVTLAFFITQSAAIKEIMLILALGLIIDSYNTWIQNAGILRWYLEYKHGKN
ncbi:preprotein translocase subunit SecF [Candidatus Woesearchaeota archaeon CG10_big_fil_rev_8_21_14_0_10_30_7]|nr:MAG: preprotein translocase subunit SecF [Candidatus Woesearchaeota archaeon CG10_big_fil_rev_8_21_14_0_10_30_7]